MRHAVDGPVCVSVLVADGDGEAAVVGAQEVDHFVVFAARQRQHGPLARVRRPVLSLVTCWIFLKKKTEMIKLHFSFVQGLKKKEEKTFFI
jgi:hypothetical protein